MIQFCHRIQSNKIIFMLRSLFVSGTPAPSSIGMLIGWTIGYSLIPKLALKKISLGHWRSLCVTSQGNETSVHDTANADMNAMLA